MSGKIEARGRCPECGYIFEEATHLTDEEAKPREGDISFCLGCGAVNVFDGVGVVPADESTFNEATRQEIAKLRSAWKIRRKCNAN